VDVRTAAGQRVDVLTVDVPTEDDHLVDDQLADGRQMGGVRRPAGHPEDCRPVCRVDAAGRGGLASTDDRRGRDCRPEPTPASLRDRGWAADPSGAGDRLAAADRSKVLGRNRRDELAGRFPVVRAAGPREAGA
jgi:hypothetical protein